MLYLTIIQRACIGYEMIDSQRGAQRRVGYNHLIYNEREWNNCFIKNNQVILVGLADFFFMSNQKTIYGRYFSDMV